ncbi:MAG: glycine cleavage system aminomethyltransferase GcvT, partial [Nitrospinaceae bacterium]|nr:glycine cleavage system aminomethyltransferase GcvT [Nitrospinaceae bacterium]NIR55168.1 glycine cleavage system aminomethyltransferase GcvT [Nitrospinaceae bacterium]NIS85592.1 glycine cleavage system aminomethyltransferase GcvT [Nitrospinaceae bacterium]NIT82438.1 glycine cleavage system aminomethyltransferase GcvT [Nitrospinaceae bacterium]NIU44651.1 glycine cleavage system aminomethyltransferase GcvT [Nitrospinaceae bacterium]
MSSTSSLKTTPFFKTHQKMNGKMVPFAGWHMPIQFAGVLEEHRAVRESVGVFDVSHMGEIEVRGRQAKSFLQKLLTNDMDRLDNGGILYSLMCYEHGGVVDDLLVHRFEEDRYFLCINASNTGKDFEWAVRQAEGFEVQVENISDRTAQLAVQGPRSEPLVQKLTDAPLAELAYYRFLETRCCGVDAIVARTGYTGEDGFEIYLKADTAVTVYENLLEAGREFDLQPIGLGARDTLRMEMGYPLYGQEIDERSSPLEAGLGWVVKLRKTDPFNGREPLKKQKDKGLSRKLVGVQCSERGVPRSHYRVLHDSQPVGEVTSGTFSPSLNTGVALCYVPTELSEVGTPLEIQIRNS